MSQKSIAVFDLSITTDSPAGSCVLQILKNLSHEYHFIVFADRFDNPDSEAITWIRVPLPSKLVIARYIVFKYLAPIYYQRFIQRQSHQPDLVISTEGEFSDCDICYVHFCHRAYLNQQILKLSSLRGVVRFVNHHFNARAEAQSLRQAKTTVVPSLGLAHELSKTYGSAIPGAIETIPNPLNVDAFTRPDSHNSSQLRAQLGWASDDIVLAFAALGDFERKGLALVVQALSALNAPQVKLVVVGGNDALVRGYKDECDRLNLSEQVRFVGFHSDIRPYLWLSDLFVLPSAYETFSLVVFQAAIAGLPIMATQLYGVEEFLQPGVNGWLVERNQASIETALKQVVERRSQLKEMGRQAHVAASQYSVPRFVEQWQKLLNTALAQNAEPVPKPSLVV